MFIMLVGTFFPVLNETVLATAYPKLMNYFSINTSTVQWLTSAFLMVAGIMIPISTWLMERIDTKSLFIGSTVIFEIGTVIAWLAPNFGTLLTARIIQAISTGIGMPLMQSIIFHIYPNGERGAAMGLGGLVIGLAPAIGPTLSGWIIDNASWRDLFSMNIFKPVLPTHHAKLDASSVILSTLGFGSILYGFSSVGQDGWGSKFDLGTAISSLAMMGLVGFEMVLPLYLQTIRGDNAFHSGLTLLAGALAIGVISPITGKIYDKFGAKWLSLSGFLLMCMGSLPFLFLTKATPVLYIVVLYAIRAIGIAMALMVVATYSLNDLPTSEVNNGTSAMNTVRQVASSIATAILTSVLSDTTKGAKPVHHLLTTNPLQYKDSMIHAALSGYHAAFAVALAFCVIGLIAAFWFTISGPRLFDR
ncbi:MAG: Hypothetical protein AJITA_00639 [Acetilactobacillus jinshanensis]